jgi:transcriptional repressor NrdR
MQCPRCKHADSQVLESRDTGLEVRRRRECSFCKHRFTTYERIGRPVIIVLKRNGGEQRFDPDKIRKGVLISCKNRPVTQAQVDSLVNAVEEQVYALDKERIASSQIGDLVCIELEKLDQIAYLRFSSVCKAFQDINQFAKEIRSIKTNHTN